MSNHKMLNGLPQKVRYCIKCNISNQQPTSTNEYKHDSKTKQITIDFGEDGICAACKSNDFKWDGTIDWKQREEELLELSKKYKNINQQYNCLVAGSGGKDSVFQSHILKYKYGMRPLTVTWAPHLYTDIGWKNFNNWISKGGFDNFLFNPNGKLHRYLTKSA
ncbi:N-acetyl sugar amidotransferase, partial [Candidatus Pelagibacter sp.]|nr:N-acetyl sugar amidotransferase [Candidatus Pelagibacter sp.]